MRLARYKVTGQDAWYHIHCRISGSRGEFPLSEALPTRKFVELLRRFSQIYFCEVAAFSVMGNHYHLVVKFQHLESISETGARSDDSDDLVIGWTAKVH